MMNGGMRGVYTGLLGVLNDAGRELHSFCSVNGATVFNMWFQKKEIHKQTWHKTPSKSSSTMPS